MHSSQLFITSNQPKYKLLCILNAQSGGLLIDRFEWIGLILIVKDIYVYQKLVKERTVRLIMISQ